jgi:HEAT repeat protein
MTAAPKTLVARIRGLLDRLAACRRLSNDDQEVVGDEVAAEARTLPREGVLEALDKAIGSSTKRRREAVYVLSELTDVPEVVERIGQWFSDPDPQWRSWLIQTVENAGLKQYAPLLNDIIENDPDPFCRNAAIHAAGALRVEENLPSLLRLAECGDYHQTWRLAWALKDYATEDCRPHLKRWFEDSCQDKQSRVIAAWGLGKLGDKQAVTYLIQMLDDLDRTGQNFFAPGESLRAAQALSDIYEWPFEWNKSYVAKTAARVRNAGLISR